MELVILLLSLIAVSAIGEELRLVMWSFKIHGRSLEVAVELKTDYGYMVLNVGTAEEPRAHYVLADQKKGIVGNFKTTKEFLAALAGLEEGGNLAHYTRCTIPSDYGLKAEDQPYGEIVTICEERGIKLSDESYMRCLCPDVKDSKR